MDEDIQERLGSAQGAQVQNPGKRKSDAKHVILTNFPAIFWQVKWKPEFQTRVDSVSPAVSSTTPQMAPGLLLLHFWKHVR